MANANQSKANIIRNPKNESQVGIRKPRSLGKIQASETADDKTVSLPKKLKDFTYKLEHSRFI